MGILKVDDLTREFRMGQEIIRALDDISFSVEQGEFVTIMGSSGSGKSTLLNILGCLDTATSGDYEIDQRKTRNLTKDQLAKIRNKKLVSFFNRTTFSRELQLSKMWNFRYSTIPLFLPANGGSVLSSLWKW